MGWAIGSAVGVALACPGCPVVCLTGDGSVLMSGQELTVAVQEKLPIIFVVLNDAGLGMVKHGQRLTGAENIGFQLPRVDFSSFAKAMGAHAQVIDSPKDVLSLDAKEMSELAIADLRRARELCNSVLEVSPNWQQCQRGLAAINETVPARSALISFRRCMMSLLIVRDRIRS